MVFIDALPPIQIFLNKPNSNEYSGLLHNGDTYLLSKKVKVARAFAISSWFSILNCNYYKLTKIVHLNCT